MEKEVHAVEADVLADLMDAGNYALWLQISPLGYNLDGDRGDKYNKL